MDGQYYGGLTKISALEVLRSLLSGGKLLQLNVALEKAKFPDMVFIRKLSEKRAQKMHRNYPNLSWDEFLTLCIFAYKKITLGNSSEKTPHDIINLSLFMRDIAMVKNYGMYILCLLCAIRQLPPIKPSEVKSLYVISELEDAHINPKQNWVNNFMSWPSFTNAYTESEAKILVRNFRNPVLFRVTGAFYAYDLKPFSNDDNTDFIILEPETKYLVTAIDDCDPVFGLKVVSVSVQFDGLVLEDFIRVIRKAPPKLRRKTERAELPPPPQGQVSPPPNNPGGAQIDINYQQYQGNRQFSTGPQGQYLLQGNTFGGFVPQPHFMESKEQFNVFAAPPRDTPGYLAPPTQFIESKEQFNGSAPPPPHNTIDHFSPPPQFITPNQTFRPPQLGEREIKMLINKAPQAPNQTKPLTTKNTFVPPPPPPEFFK